MKDANDTRNIAPRIGSPLWIYMTAVSVAGSLVLGIAIWQLHHLVALVRSPMFWVVGGLIVAGEIWRIDSPGRGPGESAAAARSITVGAMLFWGFPAAVLLRAIAVIVGGIAQRHIPQRIAFNVAQLSLSLGAAGLALWALGVPLTPVHHWMPHLSDFYALLVAAAA